MSARHMQHMTQPSWSTKLDTLWQNVLWIRTQYSICNSVTSSDPSHTTQTLMTEVVPMMNTFSSQTPQSARQISLDLGCTRAYLQYRVVFHPKAPTE